MILYGYWRSSAAYRVRIALALKGLAYETRPIDLRAGQQGSAEFLAINPQGRVPWLIDGAQALGQSLAIIDYLDELHPAPPLLPSDPAARARVRAAALTIACDIHPLGNVAVLRYLRAAVRRGSGRDRCVRGALDRDGFRALDAEVGAGPYLFGDMVTLADVCLVPQMANARRFHVNLAPFPDWWKSTRRCACFPSFKAARPEVQPDADRLMFAPWLGFGEADRDRHHHQRHDAERRAGERLPRRRR